MTRANRSESTIEPAQEPEHTNRLIHETSPYLLQHAHNPVDWYPWGPEAIAAAREQDKPIFLSVGYATCYWCHVMERESFENEEIAKILNENFICIKVDREERPDVDDIYMTAVQAMTGSGGWPMNVCLDPKTLKPFFGGTYFPAESKYGRRAFPDILQDLARAWRERRPEIETSAKRVADYVQQQMVARSSPQSVTSAEVAGAVTSLLRIHDPLNGGFGSAPKFPQPVFLQLLMETSWDRSEVQKAVVHTLDRMAMGGMYDQVGGGFHRYSTDDRWLVPHFEKMLYDNGQLAGIYAEAFERSGDTYYAQVGRGICDYVIREMQGEHGAFFSAQDAEVDQREGQNYLWLEPQIRETLTTANLAADVDFALQIYGFKNGTNFQDPHHPEDGWKNVIFLTARPDELAKQLSLTPEQFNETRQRINAALLAERNRRPQPITDDKILSGWNGLMISGLADCGRAFAEPRYLEAAERAAEFLLTHMRSEDRQLLRTYRQGQGKIDAFSSDYALVIGGLLDLYRATENPRWLQSAEELAQVAKERFWDPAAGGYFDTLDNQPDLFVRAKSSYDGAVPAGNGTMALNLIQLFQITGNAEYLSDAESTLTALSPAIAENPIATARSTLALSQLLRLRPDWQVARPTGATQKPSSVSISIDTPRIDLRQETSQQTQVHFRIDPAFHINASDPGRDDLIPLKIELLDSEGIKMEVQYPTAERYREELSIYRGDFTIPITLSRTAPDARGGKLQVTYQACREDACLLPRTVELELEWILK